MSEENKQNQKVADKGEQKKKSSSSRRRSNRRRKKPATNRSDENQKKQNQNQQDNKKDAQGKKPSGDKGSRRNDQSRKDKDRKDQRTSGKKSGGSNRGSRRDHRSDKRTDKRGTSAKGRVTFAKPKTHREAQDRQMIYKKNGVTLFMKTGEKDVRLELMDQVEPHVLFRGNNRKYYVATEYSGIMHVIVEYETYDEAKVELGIRGEHDFSHILEFEVEGNIE